MAVDRCVCTDQSFAELLRTARREGLDFDGLVARTGCCTGCGTCEPYIRLTLDTGRTVHPVLPRRGDDGAGGILPPR